MAKAMRNPQRKELRLLDERSRLIEAALEAGKVTRSDISKVTEIPLHLISDTFSKNRELFAKYSVRRRSIVDTAADNIYDIVNDKKHPQCFSASKYVLQNFKSDLDDVLEPSNSELGIEIGGDSTPSPVTIKFAKVVQSKDLDEDE